MNLSLSRWDLKKQFPRCSTVCPWRLPSTTRSSARGSGAFSTSSRVFVFLKMKARSSRYSSRGVFSQDEEAALELEMAPPRERRLKFRDVDNVMCTDSRYTGGCRPSCARWIRSRASDAPRTCDRGVYLCVSLCIFVCPTRERSGVELHSSWHLVFSIRAHTRSRHWRALAHSSAKSPAQTRQKRTSLRRLASPSRFAGQSGAPNRRKLRPQIAASSRRSRRDTLW